MKPVWSPSIDKILVHLVFATAVSMYLICMVDNTDRMESGSSDIIQNESGPSLKVTGHKILADFGVETLLHWQGFNTL